MLPIGAAHAQSTGMVAATCKDRPAFSGAKRAGACRGHGGVQSGARRPVQQTRCRSRGIRPAPTTSEHATLAPGGFRQVWVNTASKGRLLPHLASARCSRLSRLLAQTTPSGLGIAISPMPLSEPAPSRKLLSDGPSGMAQPRGRRLPLRLLLAGLGSLTLPRSSSMRLECWLNLQRHGVGSAALSSDARNWAVLLPHRWMLPRICSVASGASRSGSAARPAAGVFDPASRQ